MPLELNTGFYDLEWLTVRWGLPENHILGMALDDFLELSIHVDGLLLFRGRVIQHDHSYEKTGIVSRHYGTLPLRAHETEEIILKGSVETRCFRPRPGDDFCELEGNQPFRRIEIKDLVVAWETAHEYERSRKIKVRNLEDEKPSLINPQTQYDLIVEDGYKVVFLGPYHWNLGPMQAAIVRQLHEASIANQPWISGKQLLAGCGSESANIKDLFKRNKRWKDLILSDERGLYRLNCASHLWHRQDRLLRIAT